MGYLGKCSRLLSSDGGRDLARVMFQWSSMGIADAKGARQPVVRRARQKKGLRCVRSRRFWSRTRRSTLSPKACGQPAPQRETGKDTARGAAVCAEVSGTLDQTSCNARRGGQTNETSFLIAIGDPVVAFQGQASVTQGLSMSSKTSPTLDKSKTPCIAFDMSHADDPARLTGDKTNALQARMGTGGNQVPCIAIQDVIHGDKQCNGKGWNDSGAAYTLDTRATQGVCTPTVMAHGQGNAEVTEDICPTLNCNHEQPIYFEPRFTRISSGLSNASGVAATLTGGHGHGRRYTAHCRREVGVRRLTPMECERLQGFPKTGRQPCRTRNVTAPWERRHRQRGGVDCETTD